MDPPIVNSQNESVPLGEKLAILRYIDEDHSVLEATQEFGVSQETVAGIINSRVMLEAVIPVTTQRRNMTLGEKLKVLHFIDKDHSLLQASNKYGIAKRTVKRILGARETLIAMDKSGVPG
eukprot:IDg22032t1